MYQTIAAAVVALMLGKFLRKRVNILERFCIPAPVVGGVVFAVLTCVCYVTGIAEFSGELKSPEERRKSTDCISGTGHCTDRVTELPGSRPCKITAH